MARKPLPFRTKNGGGIRSDKYEEEEFRFLFYQSTNFVLCVKRQVLTQLFDLFAFL